MQLYPHMISISLPPALLAELRERIPERERSNFMRGAIDQALELGLRGARRRRYSARDYRQTTVLITDDQREALNELSAYGELSVFAELAFRVALDRLDHRLEAEVA